MVKKFKKKNKGEKKGGKSKTDVTYSETTVGTGRGPFGCSSSIPYRVILLGGGTKGKGRSGGKRTELWGAERKGEEGEKEEGERRRRIFDRECNGRQSCCRDDARLPKAS